MKENQLHELLFLDPVCTHNIWGGTRLREEFGYPAEGNAGESPPILRETGLSAAEASRERSCPGFGISIRNFSGICPMTDIRC